LIDEDFVVTQVLRLGQVIADDPRDPAPAAPQQFRFTPPFAAGRFGFTDRSAVLPTPETWARLKPEGDTEPDAALEVARGEPSAAKAGFEDGLAVARAFSAADPASASAKRDVIVSLDKLFGVSGDKELIREALEIAEDMAANGQLSPADAFIPDYLRKKLD